MGDRRDADDGGVDGRGPTTVPVADAGSVVRLPEDVVLVLASGSPRRLDLLRQQGIEPQVMPADIDESPHLDEDPVAYVHRLAREKAQVVASSLLKDPSATQPDVGARCIVLGADTTVDLDGRILAKPDDPDDARAMLRELSGRTHRVHTGVAIVSGGITHSGVDTTLVTFSDLSPATIEWYVGTGEPLDKAGAYAIQGHGAALVERVDGSTSNVIGLPLALVDELMRGC